MQPLVVNMIPCELLIQQKLFINFLGVGQIIKSLSEIAKEVLSLICYGNFNIFFLKFSTNQKQLGNNLQINYRSLKLISV